jgi:hypothetical protein
MLLVNSNPALDAQGNPAPGQAAYAILRPLPLTPGVLDAFVIVSAPKPTAATNGFFTQKNVFVMADFQGTGSDQVMSYNFPPSQINIAVFDPLSGALLGSMTSQSNTTTSNLVATTATPAAGRTQTLAAAWDSWRPAEPDWFGSLDPQTQHALAETA